MKAGRKKLPESEKLVQVMVRFDQETLDSLDTEAQKYSLSRAAYIRTLISGLMEKKKNFGLHYR